MIKRYPFLVFLLPFVTLGIYSLVWFYVTKHEMTDRGADIPTTWLLLIPIVNLWWLWRYCIGVEKVTRGMLAASLAFVVLLLLSSLGMAIVQSEFNQVA